MKSFLLACTFLFLSPTLFGATCTISGSGTINFSAATCIETGVAPVSGDNLIVPVGVNLNIPNTAGSPVFTGNISVYGTFTNNKANALWNGSVYVYSGGLFDVQAKIDLGNTANCGYTLVIYSGGTMNLAGSGGSDLVSICNVKIAQSGGACNPDPLSAYNGKPYCEPAGGFVGPIGYDETGYNSALPIKLAYLKAEIVGAQVHLKWATAQEENFDHFVIQRTITGSYEDLGTVKGAGFDVFDQIVPYSFEDFTPLLGNNYYRLKAIDLDGVYEYFGPVVALVKGKKSIKVFPNPSPGNQIQISTNFSPEENDRIAIFNAFGLKVTENSAQEKSLAFDTPLQAGVYIVKYYSRDGELSTPIIIR